MQEGMSKSFVKTVIIIMFEAVQIFSDEYGTNRVGILVFTEKKKKKNQASLLLYLRTDELSFTQHLKAWLA